MDVVPFDQKSEIFLMLDSNLPGTQYFNGGSRIVYGMTSLQSVPADIIRFELRSVVLQCGAYNIKDDSANHGLKNNVITFNGTPVTIPPGSYSETDLATYLTTAFSAITAATTVTYSTVTFKFTIARAGSNTIIFGATSPWYEMGFAQATYTGASIVSPTTLNLSGPPNLLISIPEIASGNLISYNGQLFHYIFPLTGAAPSLSQGTTISLGKLVCWTYQQSLSQLTVNIFYTRAGHVYPYIMTGAYQIILGVCH